MSTQTARPFGRALKDYRLMAGLTQEALAAGAGVSGRGIQALEHGTNMPQQATVQRLAAALRLDADARACFLALAAPIPRPQRSTAVLGRDDRTVAPGPAPDAAPHNLPLSLSSFVGRVGEATTLGDLLARTRLLTLIGTGGVGKTRLAVHVAGLVRDRYPQGVWLVELASLAEPSLVPQAVAGVLAIRADMCRPLPETLVAALRSKHLLLVLDNWEHLLDACALLVEMLLRACPQVQVLATSREALGLTGEVTWRVPSLVLPGAQAIPPLDLVAPCEAVQLFVERAVAVQPHFALTAATAPAVTQICRRLDGIPLALEMAAARLRGLGVDQLAARLDERFQLLTGGSRTALPRQQTLQATVEWSYNLLTMPERIVFDRLSVFAGGFTTEAAEAVCAGREIAAQDVLGLLLRLVDKSLVMAEDETATSARYRLLETLRPYGRRQLGAQADAAAVYGRHAAYFLALAEEAEPRLQAPLQLRWLVRLETEVDNLRAALRWWLEQDAVEEAVRLAVAVTGLGFWAVRVGMAERRVWLVQVLALSGAASTRIRIKALGRAGLFAAVQGDVTGAHPLLEEALILARQAGDQPATAWLLDTLGVLALQQDNYAHGQTLLEESLAQYRVMDDHWGVVEAICHLSQALTPQGAYARAEALLAEGLTIARHMGERRHLAFILEVQGEVAFALGSQADARRLWEESLAGYHQLTDILGLASVENDLGRLAVRQADYAVACAHYVSSLTYQQEGQVMWRVAGSLAGLAVVAAAQGEAAHALCLAAASIASEEATGFRLPAPAREAVGRAITTARAVLGERAATEAWAAGRAMTLEQALTFARG